MGAPKSKGGISTPGYRVLDTLGEGGMGTVYRAVHQTLGQEVALKVLDPTLSRLPEFRERFLDEAKIQFTLRHPNIVQVITAESDRPSLFLVMELIDGLSLEQVLARRKKLPLQEAMNIFGQVCDGVAFAHSMGVIHRDIKPANILIRANGAAKVTDFGIAKVSGDIRRTRAGVAMGSAAYMSPEQILGRKDIDQRTDVYSLAVMFYEMVTGRLPFEVDASKDSDSDFEIRQAHVNAQPNSMRLLDEEIPQEVDGLILRALRKDPVDRFSSVSELNEALLGALVKPIETQHARPKASRAASGPEISAWKVVLVVLSLFLAGSILFVGTVLVRDAKVNAPVDKSKTTGWTPEKEKRYQELKKKLGR